MNICIYVSHLLLYFRCLKRVDIVLSRAPLDPFVYIWYHAIIELGPKTAGLPRLKSAINLFTLQKKCDICVIDKLNLYAIRV